MTRAEIFWLVVSFLFGSAFGSFLNVCIWRLPTGKSLIWPASHCAKCFQPVGRWNIPILGYFLLRGRCHECGERFSIRYPLVELLTAGIFSGLYWLLVVRSGAPLPVYVAYVSLAMLLVVASFVDLARKIIPQQVTTLGIVLALIFSAAYPQLHVLYIGFHPGGGRWTEALARWVAKVPPIDGVFAALGGMVAGVLVILAVRYVGSVVFRREAMGMGDVKLMAVIGGFLGWRAIPLVFLVAAFVGAVAGVVSYLKTRDREVPLGPFLALAALVVMLWGNQLMTWWFVDMMRLDAAPQVVSYGL